MYSFNKKSRFTGNNSRRNSSRRSQRNINSKLCKKIDIMVKNLTKDIEKL